ncbi:MAG: TetR family transcriptional regulator [Wenzhouxiangella sp.]|nr:MAG: TetR family transcriptional regulator [Wenzhouxiangella sp.]
MSLSHESDGIGQSESRLVVRGFSALAGRVYTMTMVQASTQVSDKGTRKVERQRRGQRTRQAILDATLEVIAEGGVRAVTHRAVAARADVNLSLTTYYFNDIFDMVSSAFDDFMLKGRARVEQAWADVFASVYRYSAQERRRKAVRETLRIELTRIGVDFLFHELSRRRAGTAVEHHFYFEALHDPRLRELYEASRQPTIKQMTRFAELFNRQSPEVDAELLIGTIFRIEHSALGKPVEALDRAAMEAMLGRALGWIMHLNDPWPEKDKESRK